MRIKLYITLGLLIMAFSGKAQIIKNLGGQRAGISALPFLKLEVSPRSDAMAGAQISSEGDAFASNWNPAAMTSIEHPTVGISEKLLPAGISYAYLTGIYPTENYNYWSLNLAYLGSGQMEKRTAFQPNGTGQYFSASNMAIGASFAKILSERFRFGGSAKYVREQLAEFTAHAAVIDLGFLYKTNYQGLNFAVLVQNFGSNSTINGEFNQLTLPGTDPSRDINEYPTPTVFKLGISMVPWKSDERELETHVQLNHPNDNAENIRLGVEHDVHRLVALRAGYKVNVKHQSYPTFGAGIQTRIGRNPLGINYAFIPTDFLGSFHNIGLSFSINTQKRE